MNTLKNINEKDKNLWQRFRLSTFKKKNPYVLITMFWQHIQKIGLKREVQDVEEHLASCSECFNALKELRVLRKEKILEPPAGVKEKAKALVNIPIAKKKQLFVRLPLWMENPFLYAKYSLA